jgi:hypothetical protein
LIRVAEGSEIELKDKLALLNHSYYQILPVLPIAFSLPNTALAVNFISTN